MNCSVLTDSCTVLHLPLYPFRFEFSWSKNLFERCVTVAYAYCMLFICHTELSGFDYYYCTNAANENCDEFCVKGVFKCRERRMMQQDEEWTKAQAWGCPCHPKKYPRSTSVKAWGCPSHPLFIIKKHQVIFQCAIFLLLHAICVILGASLFSVVCFIFQ